MLRLDKFRSQRHGTSSAQFLTRFPLVTNELRDGNMRKNRNTFTEFYMYVTLFWYRLDSARK